MTTRLAQNVDPAIAAVWAQRAADLACVPEAQDQGERVTFVVFRLGREAYAIDARYVLDVRPAGSLARVPRVPAWVAGLTVVRGRILSVLDLAAYFGLPTAGRATNQAGQHLLLVETPAMELCLLVGEVVAVVPLAVASLKETATTMHVLPPEYLIGVAIAPAATTPPWGHGPLVVLDLPALLADKRIIINQEGI